MNGALTILSSCVPKERQPCESPMPDRIANSHMLTKRYSSDGYHDGKYVSTSPYILSYDH
jgi:hypothetical protein